MIELRHLQCALLLAEVQHYGRAAKQLGISQPTLTRTIQALEATAGGKLFDRGRSGVSPTALGKRVLAHAHEIDELLEGLHDDIEGARLADADSVLVGTSVDDAHLLSEAIARMKEARPHVRTKTMVDTWATLTKRLFDRQVRLTVSNIEAARNNPKLRYVALGKRRVVLTARRGHPLAHGNSVSASDVLEYPLMSPSISDNRHMEVIAKIPGIDLSLLSESLSYEFMKESVRGSDTIAAFPINIVRDEIESGEFVALPTEFGFDYQPSVVWLAAHTLLAVEQAFIDTVVAIDEAWQAEHPEWYLPD